jgi:hypothetical protein
VTGLDVVDTAVKIGLGAIISGLSAYALSKRAVHTDILKERLRRREALLELIAELVTSFSHLFLVFWARSSEVARVRRRGAIPTKDQLDRAAAAHAELFNAFEKLSAADARMLLLDDNEGHVLVRAVGDEANRTGNLMSEGNTPLSEAEYTEIAASFRRARE